MTARSLSSHFMVEAGRARIAAPGAKANGHDPVSSIAPFVNHAMRVYRVGTDEIAAELLMMEADAWNARARTDEHRGRK